MQFLKFASMFCVCLVLCHSVTYAESNCALGYVAAKHVIHFGYSGDLNDAVVITAKDAVVANSTFILSEDGYCPDGYVPYSRSDDNIYPIVETSPLCGSGQYNANGTCVNYDIGDCSAGRYNMAIVSSSFTASEDGYCVDGYIPYSRRDDYIYPIVSENILCASGQYPGSAGCQSYVQSTCPNGYVSYSLNSNTIAQQTNNVCPSNYVSYTYMKNCDVVPGDTCADIPTVIDLKWYDGVNSDPLYTSSCTYNETFSLPAEPVRPGYTFVGWKVRQN